MSTSPIRSKLKRMAVGLVLFALMALSLSLLFPDAAPPAFALGAAGGIFSAGFGVFGQPIRLVPWREGGRFGVLVSYVISSVCVAAASYGTWVLFSWSRPECAA
jgi:hypothetical protein